MRAFASQTLAVRTRERAFLAACACCCAVALALPAAAARAEDIDTNPDPDALQQQVERTAAAYDDALAAVREAENALADNQARIGELEALIPEQQARGDAAARTLYKLQHQSLGVVDLILSADDFFDFLTSVDYVNRVTATNVAEIARLNDMREQFAVESENLEAAKRDAEANALEAERALTAAQEARLEAQRKAQEAARQAAEAAEAAKAAASSASRGSDADAGGSAEVRDTTAATTSSADEAVAVIDDGANWTEDEGAFIASWSARIDDYLSGSPLAGQGRAFAQAAWDYGVDPRWSPAISYTESSLGAFCFLPHNAWGWGSSSWGSWGEAIDAHVRGLARGYGYTISMESAQKYCPSGPEHWYETTLAQMNQI